MHSMILKGQYFDSDTDFILFSLFHGEMLNRLLVMYLGVLKGRVDLEDLDHHDILWLVLRIQLPKQQNNRNHFVGQTDRPTDSIQDNDKKTHLSRWPGGTCIPFSPLKNRIKRIIESYCDSIISGRENLLTVAPCVPGYPGSPLGPGRPWSKLLSVNSLKMSSRWNTDTYCIEQLLTLDPSCPGSPFFPCFPCGN